MNYGAEIEKSTASELGARDLDTISKDSLNAFSLSAFRPERQDKVIDFTPDEPDTVLIQFDEDRDSFPSIVELNINTGSRIERIGENPPIRQFVTDGRGHPRIGWGSTEQSEYHLLCAARWRTRMAATRGDRGLQRYESPAAHRHGGGGEHGLCRGDHDGRDSLWSIDLADKREPQLLFHHRSSTWANRSCTSTDGCSGCATTSNGPTSGTRIRSCAS